MMNQAKKTMLNGSTKALFLLNDVKNILKGNKADFVQTGLLWALIAIAGIPALILIGIAIYERFDEIATTFQSAELES